MWDKMNILKRKITMNPILFTFFILISMIVASIVTLATFYLYQSLFNQNHSPNDFDKIETVYEQINNEYYKDVDEDKLIDSAIDGMVEGLEDPYSEYLTEEELTQFDESISGNFEGIGAEIEQRDNEIFISSPIKGSPAEKEGLQPKDQIIGIDGDSIEGQDVNDAVKKIRGEKGTTVTLTIVRGNQQPFDVEITRDKIHMDSVSHQSIENESTDIITISRFQQGTHKELSNVLDEVVNNDHNHLILDFRNNPGGLLDEAVNMIGLFVGDNKVAAILETRDGKQQEVKTNIDQVDGLEDKTITIVLNEGSASASEVFAGALQDHINATVVGESSYGKGVVQTTKQFGNELLKYTNSKWLTPNERWIHDKGIKPDKVIKPSIYKHLTMLDSDKVYKENSKGEDIQFIEFGLQSLGYSIKSPNKEFDSETEKALKAFQQEYEIKATGEMHGKTTDTFMKVIFDHLRNDDPQMKNVIQFVTQT